MKNRLDYNAIPWKDLVYYDESSPSCLRWNIARNKGGARSNIGDAIGVKMKFGYFKFGFNNHEYYCHRVVWILHNNVIDNSQTIDHFDRDTSNNKITNLRQVPQRTNSQNTKLSKNSSSGVTGVSFNYNRGSPCWQAYINGVNGRIIKSFGVGTYGYEGAFELACAHRKKLIEEQNNAGTNYSETHGT